MAESLLPKNLQDESNLAMEYLIKDAFNFDMKRIMTSVVDYLPDNVLPYLAEARHIMGDEGWNLCNTRAEKIALIKESVPLHRKKGTVGAVQDIFKTPYHPMQYLPWYQYGGIPHHYKIDIDFVDEGLSSLTEKLLNDKLNQFKQLRAKLDVINIHLTTVNKINFSSGVVVGEIITVNFVGEMDDNN